MISGEEAGTGLRSAKIVSGGLELVLNNTLAAVEDGRREILRFLGAGTLTPLVQHRLEVLFEELVSNTIRHGFDRHSGQSIHVRVKKMPQQIELTFEDDGKPFNPLDVEAPEPFTGIEAARIGGQGVPLIVKLSSGLRYERPEPLSGGNFAPSNRTIVSLAF